MDTLQTFARRPIAVAHRIRIDISLAVACLAQLLRTGRTVRITKVTISAQLTALSKVSKRTFQADDLFAHLQTSTVLHARAAFAIELTADQRITIEAFGALIARIARRVVLANTTSRLRIANIRMFIAVARYARLERTATRRTVPEAGRTRFAKLSQVAERTCALFHPGGRSTRRSAVGRLQFDVIEDGFALCGKCAAYANRC